MQDSSDCLQTRKQELNQSLFTWFHSFLPPIPPSWIEHMWCFTKWLGAMPTDMPRSRINPNPNPTLLVPDRTSAFPENQCCVTYGKLGRAMWAHIALFFSWVLDYIIKAERKQKGKRNMSRMSDDRLMWSKPVSLVKSLHLVLWSQKALVSHMMSAWDKQKARINLSG